MSGWRWLTQPGSDRPFIWRVILKALLLFGLLNLLFALLDPLDFIGRLSLYNTLVPGRLRLPYGEDTRAYNLSLDNLEAMFASHVIARPKAPDEYRVIIIGDSSVWGVLLRPDETTAGILNTMNIMLNSGQHIRVYNLGHPILALSKDLLILDNALRYQPDLVIWFTTLRSFPRSKQFDAPIVQRNADHVRRLFSAYALNYDLTDKRLNAPTFLQKTIVGQRRALADWLRLQLFGVMWGVTGIDQYYPAEITLRTSDFENDLSWEDYLTPQPLNEADLAFDLLAAGHQRAGEIPLLLVNEPIFISSGTNSDLRYNLWYPKWAYNSYRTLFERVADRQNWHYLDLWNSIDPAEFTDSPVHLTPSGSCRLAEILVEHVQSIANEDNQWTKTPSAAACEATSRAN